MSSVEIIIVSEGQTEQTFVRSVLAPYIAHKGIYLHAALLGKPQHKGGNNFERAKSDIGNFLKQRDNTYISTMFDYFHIDGDWPGLKEVRREAKQGAALSTTQKAETLETATLNAIVKAFSSFNTKKRFIPYIVMHEFEALLFSNAELLAEKTDIDVNQIKAILDQFDNPEEINDDQGPSKRLLSLKKSYRKVAMGKTVAEAIGIQAIREKCPHFNAWLTKLENLNNPKG